MNTYPLIKHRQQRLADTIIKMLEEDAAIKEELLEALQGLISFDKKCGHEFECKCAWDAAKAAIAHATSDQTYGPPLAKDFVAPSLLSEAPAAKKVGRKAHATGE